MTHTPPVPAANQSPYPLQEPPHPKAPPAPPPGDKRIAKTPDRTTPATPTLIAVAAGIGIAAVAGGLFYALRDTPKSKTKKRKAKAKPQD